MFPLENILKYYYLLWTWCRNHFFKEHFQLLQIQIQWSNWLLSILRYNILLQIVLLAVVLLAFLGNEGHRLTFGKQDFLGVGVTLGLAIVIPIILVAYVLGGSLFVMVRQPLFSSPFDILLPLYQARYQSNNNLALENSNGFLFWIKMHFAF